MWMDLSLWTCQLAQMCCDLDGVLWLTDKCYVSILACVPGFNTRTHARTPQWVGIILCGGSRDSDVRHSLPPPTPLAVHSAHPASDGRTPPNGSMRAHVINRLVAMWPFTALGLQWVGSAFFFFFFFCWSCPPSFRRVLTSTSGMN